MPRLHRLTLAVLALGAACRGPQPVTTPPSPELTPDAFGKAVTLALPHPTYVAIYEASGGRPLVRISPVTPVPVDSMTLPAPAGVPPEGRAGLEPHITVTTPDGAERPFGESGTWISSRITWTRAGVPGARETRSGAPLWFIVWLSRPVTPTMDSIAATLDLACCPGAATIAARLAMALGLAPDSVRALSPR